MRRLFRTPLKVAATVAGLALMANTPSFAEPTRCMRDGVAYGDGVAGSTNRWTSPEWFDAYYYYLDTYCTTDQDYPPDMPQPYCLYVNGMWICM